MPAQAPRFSHGVVQGAFRQKVIYVFNNTRYNNGNKSGVNRARDQRVETKKMQNASIDSSSGLSIRIERMRGLQGKRRVSQEQDSENSSSGSNSSQDMSILAQFDLLLPIAAKIWGYTDVDLCEINSAWRNSSFMTEVVNQWREEMLRNHIEIPETTVTATQTEERFANHADRTLGSTPREKSDDKWILGMIDMFPRARHQGLLLEYGKMFLGELSQNNKATTSDQPEPRRDANLWLLSKARLEQPDQYAAMSRKKKKI